MKNTFFIFFFLLFSQVPMLGTFFSCQAYADEAILDLGDDDDGLSLEEGGDDIEENDFEKLGTSHLSPISGWEGVRPLRRRRKKQEGHPPVYHWAGSKAGFSPLDNQEIFTLVKIPVEAEYRIYLRHRLDCERYHPVSFKISRWGKTDKIVKEHTFGKLIFLAARSGKEQEKTLPLRFESEPQLIGIPGRPAMVWEYWDVKLKKGDHRIALQSGDKKALVHSLFISTSKSFRPSLTDYGTDKTFDRIYLRFKIVEGKTKEKTYDVSGNLTYHWPRRVPRASQPAWGWGLGKLEGVPAAGWSPFLDGTEAMVLGGGPWSTCNLVFKGLKTGRVKIQLAWFPHEAAVIKEVEVEVYNGFAQLRLPNGAPRVKPSGKVGVWGVLPSSYSERVKTRSEIMARYMAWAAEAEKKLGLGPEHPRTRAFRLITGGVHGSYSMLARLGVNWIPGAPAAVKKKLNLFPEDSSFFDGAGYRGAPPETASKAERALLLRCKIGDEIPTYCSASSTNGSFLRHREFEVFLAQQAKRSGLSKEEFMGVSDYRIIKAIDKLPHNPGVYERRLFHASQSFAHLASVPSRAKQIRSLEKIYPNIHVYNNYSPHPVFLTGSTMNHCDWFVLCRNKAQTLGWGEDWAYVGTWGLYTRWQIVSYLAAIVDCSVRKYGYPGGFYAGVNCGGGAQKIFSCISQGLTWIELYSWGPLDAGAEGSNFWSECKSQYYSVLAASCALGPADDILKEGKRDPRRVAILYNRSHEIWHGGKGRMNHDWMWTFIALLNRQIPVEVIIEEDLNEKDLSRYDVLYVGGFNLARRHLAAVKQWVDRGGLLIGTAGAAMRDANDRLNPMTEVLFGAKQQILNPPPPAKGEPVPPPPEVTFPKSEFFPEVKFSTRNLLSRITPTGAKVVGTFADGSPAAVVNSLGKGKTILLAFLPGYSYATTADPKTGKSVPLRANKPRPAVQKWIAAPVLARLGRPGAEFSGERTEATVYRSKKGIAVLLSDHNYVPPHSCQLSVKADREITSVKSALKGELKWKKKDGRIVIELPVINPVDVIILR